MTQKQMIEMVRQHHPSVTEAQIRLWLNAAMTEFSRRTRILSGAFQFSTIANQRYYGLDGSILEIRAVDYTNDEGELEAIPRLVGRPAIRDIT